MHTETNLGEGPNGDEAVNWLWKEWANVLRVRNDGVPIVGFTWYSLTDQVDWDIALREDNGRVNPLGLYDLDRKIRPVGRLQEADRGLARGAADAERLPARAGRSRRASRRRRPARAARGAAAGAAGALERRARQRRRSRGASRCSASRTRSPSSPAPPAASAWRPRRRFGAEGARVVIADLDAAKGRGRRDGAAARPARPMPWRCPATSRARPTSTRVGRRRVRALRPPRRRRQQRRPDDLQAARGARRGRLADASCASTCSARSGSSSRRS